MFAASRNTFRAAQLVRVFQRHQSKIAPPPIIKPAANAKKTDGLPEDINNTQTTKIDAKQVTKKEQTSEMKESIKVPVKKITAVKKGPIKANKQPLQSNKYFTGNRPLQLKPLPTIDISTPPVADDIVDIKSETANDVKSKFENDLLSNDHDFEIEQVNLKDEAPLVMLSHRDYEKIEQYSSSKVAFLQDYATLISLGGSEIFNNPFAPPPLPKNPRYNIFTNEWNDNPVDTKHILSPAKSECYFGKSAGNKGRKKVHNLSSYFSPR